MKKFLGILIVIFYSSEILAEQITFFNLKSNIKKIPKVSWNYAQDLLRANHSKSNTLVELEVYVGPNTKLYFKDNEKDFKDVYGIFWDDAKRILAEVVAFMLKKS